MKLWIKNLDVFFTKTTLQFWTCKQQICYTLLAPILSRILWLKEVVFENIILPFYIYLSLSLSLTEFSCLSISLSLVVLLLLSMSVCLNLSFFHSPVLLYFNPISFFVSLPLFLCTVKPELTTTCLQRPQIWSHCWTQV